MSLFQFPFLRKSLPTLGNPVFVDDILAANQLALDGLGSLFSGTTFAIISGLTYTAGTPGTYSSGIVWMNGSFYYARNGIGDGQYLIPANVDTNPQPFSDTNLRNTYTLVQAVAGPQGTTSSPVFAAGMNQYRMDLNTLKAAVISAANTLAGLGNVATLNIGQITGTVAAGDDPRLVGNSTYYDNRYAQRVNVIEKGTATAYTPVNPNDPVNKSYADQFIKVLAKGYAIIGNADSAGGTLQTIAFGTNLNTTNYRVEFSIESLSANPATDTFYHVVVANKTTVSFQLYFRMAQPGTKNVNVAWAVVSL